MSEQNPIEPQLVAETPIQPIIEQVLPSNTVDKPKKLTPKQAMFVIEYLKDLNGTQAAIRAGYSEDTAQQIASENLLKPLIHKAIEEQMAYRAQRTLITADYVLASMKEVAERCLERKPVMVFNRETGAMEQSTAMVIQEDGTTKEEGVWEFDSAGANKALENLARNQKLLTDKTEVGNLDGTNFDAPIIKRVFVSSKEAAAEEMKQEENEQ